MESVKQNPSMKQQHQMNLQGTEAYPPCDDMTLLIRQLQEAGITMGGDVLDAGCGHGRFTRFVAQLSLVATVTGVDSDLGKLERAHGLVPGRVKNKIKYVNSDIGTFLENNDERYDVIAAFGLLDFIKKPCELIKELKSRLKDGGYLIGAVAIDQPYKGAMNIWADNDEFFGDYECLSKVDIHSPDALYAVFVFQNNEEETEEDDGLDPTDEPENDEDLPDPLIDEPVEDTPDAPEAPDEPPLEAPDTPVDTPEETEEDLGKEPPETSDEQPDDDPDKTTGEQETEPEGGSDE